MEVLMYARSKGNAKSIRVPSLLAGLATLTAVSVNDAHAMNNSQTSDQAYHQNSSPFAGAADIRVSPEKRAEREAARAARAAKKAEREAARQARADKKAEREAARAARAALKAQREANRAARKDKNNNDDPNNGPDETTYAGNYFDDASPASDHTGFSLPVERDHPTTIDRRPIFTLVLGNGDTESPKGRNTFWRQPTPQAFEYIRGHVTALADVGVRRFLFHAPGGKGFDQRLPPAQFANLEDDRIAAFTALFSEMKSQYPGIEFGFYVGWGIDLDPSNLPWVGDGDGVVPEILNPAHRDAIIGQYEPAKQMGADFIIFDAISSRIWGNGQTNDWMNFIANTLDIEVIGEAYPNNTNKEVTEESVAGNSYFALYRYLDKKPSAVSLASGTCPTTHQFYASLNGHAPGWWSSQQRRFELVSEVISNGFIPAITQMGSYPTEEDLELASFAVRAEAALYLSNNLAAAAP